MREPVVERKHDDKVGPHALDQLDLAFLAREKWRHLVGTQSGRRVAVPGDDAAGASGVRRHIHRSGNEVPMTKVQAIERPDGDNGAAFLRLEHVEAH